MSVNTTASEALDQARDNVKNAIKALSEILIDECWGHESYDKERLYEIMSELIRMRAKLG